MIHKKIDTFVFSFFQRLVRNAKRFGISLGLLTNSALAVHIIALLAQVYFLIKAKEGVVNILLLTLPTLLAALYFFRITRKAALTNLDTVRMLANLFACIETFSFSIKLFFKITSWKTLSQLEIYSFAGGVAYFIAWIAFPIFLYFLSCVEQQSREQKLLK